MDKSGQERRSQRRALKSAEKRELQRLALESVESSVASARTTLLTINVVCAFLFILVFEMMFGWQSMRPSASTAIFSEQLAVLAARDLLSDSTKITRPILTKHSRAIVSLARKHYCNLVSSDIVFLETCKTLDSFATLKDTLRNRLWDTLSSAPTWKQEEQIRLFIKEVDSYESSAVAAVIEWAKRKAPTPVSLESKFVSKMSDAPTEVSLRRDFSRPADMRVLEHDLLPAGYKQVVGSFEALAMIDSASASIDSVLQKLAIAADTLALDPDIAFALGEIRDRGNVNDQTRGIRVAPRKYSIPIVGTVTQIEDVNIPVAVFLIILTVWLFTATSRATNAAHLCHNLCQLDQDQHQRTTMLRLIVSKFYYLECKGEPNKIKLLDRSMIFFLTPYLATLSGVIVGIYEAALLDSRYHGSSFFLASELIQASQLFYSVLILSAIVLGILAWLMFWELQRLAFDLSGLPMNSDERLTKHRIGVSRFCWVLASPFIVFGSFSCLMCWDGCYRSHYFLTGGYLLTYAAILMFFVACTFCLFKFDRATWWQASQVAVFVALPVLIVLLQSVHGGFHCIPESWSRDPLSWVLIQPALVPLLVAIPIFAIGCLNWTWIRRLNRTQTAPPVQSAP